MEILIKKLDDQAKLPSYGSEVEPGMNLYSLVEVTIEPGSKAMVSTGVAMAMPVNYVGLIRSQYDMVPEETIKVKVDIVDSGYRDEVIVELTNTGSEARTFAAGELIAHMLVHQVHHAHLIEADELSAPEEGAGE